MKRILLFLAIALAVSGIQAAPVSQMDARHIADNFFMSHSSRFMAPAAQAVTRLAYTADQERFYIFDRGDRGGFVVVSGDDRLPQVLGYGDKGDFSVTLPPAVQYWMDEMNRQIEYLQSHSNVPAHLPVKRTVAVDPLLTTQWDQDSPYNDLCPTYTEGGKIHHAASGCVATAMVQVMNYHKWPAVGRGSHSYTCNVNGTTPTELYADFSQSEYKWDLMLDQYDNNSSSESCEAVARLMLDAGISVDMDYGSSSGASEAAALRAFQRYFDYYDRSYILARDYYNADDWDQFLVDELSARRPILYCGYSTDAGHAFVFDGFNADGYFHVNWGWSGYYDGYFMVSLLKPGGTDFKYMHDAMFGVTPSSHAEEVEDVLYVRSSLVPSTTSAQLGSEVTVKIDDFIVQGNKATGYDTFDNGDKRYYIDLPMSLGLFDSNGIERQHIRYDERTFLGDAWSSMGRSISFNLLESLEDGDYKIKLFYSIDEGLNYDQEVLNHNGQEVYVKMIVRDGIAYLYDCFLSNKYTVDSFVIPASATVNEPINVDVSITYRTWWGSNQGPLGNVYLSMLKEGDTEEMATSEMYEVQLQANTSENYQMQITAPADWGRYRMALKDEDGNRLMMTPEGWSWEDDEALEPIFVLPVCDALIEDFESMTANNSTSETNVQGTFTTWSFSKAGVRSPDEDRCNGTNSVMVKKAGFLYTSQPLAHNFFLAQATFFNPVAYDAKYSLEYSLNGGSTWIKALTIDGENMAEVPKKSQATKMWLLNLTAMQPAQFRIAMVGGGTGATYIDDVVFYYVDTDLVGDLNGDGEVGIADINVLINIILSSLNSNPNADINGDKEITVADINALVNLILSQ